MFIKYRTHLQEILSYRSFNNASSPFEVQFPPVWCGLLAKAEGTEAESIVRVSPVSLIRLRAEPLYQSRSL